MTTYPQKLGMERYKATMKALQADVAKLKTRTAGIDSGFPLMVLPAVIDSGYTVGSGNPQAYVNGAAALSGPYAFLAPYTPAAGDQVLLLPVPALKTYVIAGSVTPDPWHDVTPPSGLSGTLRYRLREGNTVEVDCQLTVASTVASGTITLISGLADAYTPQVAEARDGVGWFPNGTPSSLADAVAIAQMRWSANTDGTITVQAFPGGAGGTGITELDFNARYALD